MWTVADAPRRRARRRHGGFRRTYGRRTKPNAPESALGSSGIDRLGYGSVDGLGYGGVSPSAWSPSSSMLEETYYDRATPSRPSWPRRRAIPGLASTSTWLAMPGLPGHASISTMRNYAMPVLELDITMPSLPIATAGTVAHALVPPLSCSLLTSKVLVCSNNVTLCCCSICIDNLF